MNHSFIFLFLASIVPKIDDFIIVLNRTDSSHGGIACFKTVKSAYTGTHRS